MDPIGTLRREEHPDEGHTIWARIDPGYPDNQLTDTEWTAVWSTAPGNIGCRLGDPVVTQSPIFGAIPGTPASTGSDVEIGAPVETLPGTTYWTDEPLRGRVHHVSHADISPRYFTIQFDEPQVVTSGDGTHEFPARYTHWGMSRLSFRLIEEDS